MISPVPFSVREILEVTLLIAARYLPEQLKQDMEDGSPSLEIEVSSVTSTSGNASSKNYGRTLLVPAAF